MPNVDQIEQHYIDQFPTNEHMKTGRNKGLQAICGHAKLNMHYHLTRMKFNVTKRSHPVSHRSKPKMKKFGSIDKKNLYDI